MSKPPPSGSPSHGGIVLSPETTRPLTAKMSLALIVIMHWVMQLDQLHPWQPALQTVLNAAVGVASLVIAVDIVIAVRQRVTVKAELHVGPRRKI